MIRNNLVRTYHAPTKPHWARVVGYGPFSLCVIHKEGLCPSSRDNNRLMMMMYHLSPVSTASGADPLRTLFELQRRIFIDALGSTL
jgi:hypothetical protein